MRASCTCADTASKLGRCKHAVGLLLWCKNEKNVSYLQDLIIGGRFKVFILRRMVWTQEICTRQYFYKLCDFVLHLHNALYYLQSEISLTYTAWRILQIV